MHRQGARGSLVQQQPIVLPFSPGGIAFQTFGNAVAPGQKLVTVHSAGYLPTILSFLYSNFPPPTLPTQDATVPALPRDWKISETPSPDGDYNVGAVGRSEAFPRVPRPVSDDRNGRTAMTWGTGPKSGDQKQSEEVGRSPQPLN
jgi:hypothetical protein